MQETTFYKKMQKSKGLDLRDSRGKRHDLSFVLLGLILGLLRKRDGCLSSIHRSMVNNNEALCSFLSIDYKEVISRSHLPILLSKVCLHTFEGLIFENYGVELSETEKSWFAGDGKELRGSIERGERRGEVIVQLVKHSDREVLGQNFYNGKKESEKTCLRELIVKTGASNQKITADALHLNPATTNMISESGGCFLIGLKGNQKELLGDMKKCSTYLIPVNQEVTIDKGHGRLEKRTYFHYKIGNEYFDDRWEKTNFQSLFKVIRQRLNIKTNKESIEIDYYISNAKNANSNDFFLAIRNHWSVEVNNHIRDVTLQEDKMKTKKRL